LKGEEITFLVSVSCIRREKMEALYKAYLKEEKEGGRRKKVFYSDEGVVRSR
jgi:hypothetical protein